MSRDQITPSDIAEASSRTLRGELYHSMPGKVVAFNAGGGGSAATVDVQPMVNDVRRDPVSNARESEPWPTIHSVPVAYPRGGGYTLQFPMRAGDAVTLVAFDLDPTAWRQQGANGGPQDPPDIRRHGGGHWYAIPCDLTDPGALQSSAAAANALVVGVDGGQPQIVINGSTIQLGASGGDFVALASKVDAINRDVKALAQKLALVAVNGTTGDVSGSTWPAVVSAATALAGSISSVASALVAAQ